MKQFEHGFGNPEWKMAFLQREKRAVEMIAKVRHHVLDRWESREVLSDGTFVTKNKCLRCGAEVKVFSKPGETFGKVIGVACLTPKKAVVDRLEKILAS